MNSIREGALKIIVVEDDRDINNLIAYNLRRYGFSVGQVYDGNSAVALLKEDRFDVVIIDIMLPGFNGFEVCRQLKGSEGSKPAFVIIVSTLNSPEEKLYAHILGADCYFSKPFSMTGLIDIVKEFSSTRKNEYCVQIK